MGKRLMEIAKKEGIQAQEVCSVYAVLLNFIKTLKKKLVEQTKNIQEN